VLTERERANPNLRKALGPGEGDMTAQWTYCALSAHIQLAWCRSSSMPRNISSYLPSSYWLGSTTVSDSELKQLIFQSLSYRLLEPSYINNV
jgi:hypothetical protein